jgi:O-antigen ligase
MLEPMSETLTPRLEWLSWLICPIIFILWQEPRTHYSNLPIWALVTGLVVLVALGARVHWLVWLWWGLGALTLAWSLTPGNTLNLGLWEALYVAAFAAGAASSRQFGLAFWGLNAVLLGYGLYQALSLNALAGDLIYFSGSLHYVLGAQALITALPLYATLLRNSGKWMLLIWIGTIISFYAVMISGARSAYVPLILLVGLSAFMSWRGGVKAIRIVMVTGLIVLFVVATDIAIPFHPVQTALKGKTNLQKQLQDTQGGGSIISRLQMWDQTFGMVLAYPFGTGGASFKDVLPAFQKYPTILWANAHNYYVELLATGGWLRLMATLCLLVWVFWVSFKTSHWYFGTGVLALWMSLAFDITSYFPGMMMLAFCGLGMVVGNVAQGLPKLVLQPKLEFAARVTAYLAIAGLVVWWYAPCQGVQCAFDRRLGRSNEVFSLVLDKSLGDAQRRAYLDTAQRLNPKSAWVWDLRLKFAITPQQKLETWREITRRFPRQYPEQYLEWATTALITNNKPEAIRALGLGLKYFPLGLQPAGAPTVRPDSYQQSQTKMRRLLQKLRAEKTP